MGRKARIKRVAASVDVATPESSLDIKSLAVSRSSLFGIVAGLALAVLSIFFQLRSHQFVNFDDPIYASENTHVRAGLTLDGLRWAMTSMEGGIWHPLTWLTYMADVQMFGTDPGPHLLVNAFLHFLNSLLVFAFLFATTRRVWRSGFVAGLFAVHPLHVESVAWISERKDVLCAFFFLLAILLHCRFAQTRSRLLYLGVIAAFCFGLMSKGMIITLPFVLLVVDYWPLQRWSPTTDWGRLKPLILEKIPLFLLVVPAAVLSLKAQEHAKAITTNISLLARFANAAMTYVAYLGKTFWPRDLSVFYPIRAVIAPSVAILALLFLIVITVLVVRQAAIKPYLAAGWFWYLGILVPVIGIVQIGLQSMADRYTYLPLIGIFAALTWLASELIHSRVLLAIVASVVIVLLTVGAYQQAEYWQDDKSLFSHAAEVTPSNFAERNLGQAFISSHEYESAAQHYRLALELDPRNGPSHNGLGVALNAIGDSEGAVREWRDAVAADPTLAQPYRNLGWSELTAGRKKEAAALFEKAISLQPAPRYYAELASANGNLEEAIRRYQEAIAAEPDSAEIRNDFAAMLSLAGRNQQARQQYEISLRLTPEQFNTEMNLGTLLTRMEQSTAAIDHFRRASIERPRSFEPHIYLAMTCAQLGRTSEAVAEMQKALTMDPANANAAVLQSTGGKFDGQSFIAAMQAPHSN